MKIPFAKNLPDNNIYAQLNLEVSAKLPQVKKAYDIKVKVLQGAIKSVEGPDKQRLESELSSLQDAYDQFTGKISGNNAKFYKTMDSLNSLGLKGSADWNQVEAKYSGMSDEAKEKHREKYDYLKENQEMITKNPKLNNTTFIGVSAVLGMAGISLTAFHYLDQEQVEQAFNSIVENPSVLATGEPQGHIVTEKEEVPVHHTDVPDSIQTTDDVDTPDDTDFPDDYYFSDDEYVAPLSDGFVTDDTIDVEALMDEETLQSFIDDNLQIEDEMLAMLGLVPDPAIDLSIQHKLQVFAALVSAI